MRRLWKLGWKTVKRWGTVSWKHSYDTLKAVKGRKYPLFPLEDYLRIVSEEEAGITYSGNQSRG